MLRLLVSGFTGQEAVARATSRRGPVVLRRMRPRSGYARAVGQRILGQPRVTGDAGQLAYVLANNPRAFLKKNRDGPGFVVAGLRPGRAIEGTRFNLTSEWDGIWFGRAVVDSLVRRGVVEERHGGRFYLVRGRTATYRPESRFARGRMRYSED